MQKLGTIELYSPRLWLRKLAVSDAAQLYKNVFSDSEVSAYMSWDIYPDVQAVERYLTQWQKDYENNECYWGVFLKENQTLVGTVYLCDENKNAEVGFLSYCLGSEFWGNGYATEAVKTVLEYGFSEIGYQNIVTFVAKSNQRSQNVLTRLGFVCEAALRSRDKTAFGLEDVFCYSLLKNEMK